MKMTMNKINSLDDLRRMRDTQQASMALRERSNAPERYVQVAVSMSSCGIHAGAKEIMRYFIHALDANRVEAIVTQTDCLGFCYAEPTVLITLPGKNPVLYGHVTNKLVDEIIQKLEKGEEVEKIQYVDEAYFDTSMDLEEILKTRAY